MKRATIIGPYLIENFGDDLIGAILAKNLKEKGYEVHLPGLSQKNCNQLGIHFTPSRKKAILDSKLIVIGGGGILGDAGVKPNDIYRKMALKAAITGKLLNKKVVITGVGAGPLTFKRSKRLTKAACYLAQKVGVRDKESSEFLKKIGVNPKKIKCGADIALLTEEAFQVNMINRNTFGFQFDVDHFPDIQTNPELTSIKETLINIINQDFENSLIITNGKSNSQLTSLLKSNPIELNYSGDLASFIKQLNNISAIFTSHLHLAITAYSLRIPCFSLYVREKTKRFYNQIGHPERAIPLKTATKEDCNLLLNLMKTCRWTAFDENRLKELKTESNNLLNVIPK